MAKQNVVESGEIKKLGAMLERVVEIYEKDRKLAETNYESLRAQLDNIIGSGMESSEDGKIEAEVNKALKLVFDSATRLQGVIEVVSRIIIANLNAEAKRDVANIFNGKGGLAKVNINSLLEDNHGPRDDEEEPDGD